MRRSAETVHYAAPISCEVVGTLGISHQILDFTVIIIGWTLFIGVMMYPALHLVGLLICAAILLHGAAEHGRHARQVRVLKAAAVKADC